MTFVRERYRSFNSDPTQTIAVLGNASSGRDYEVDAQLMIAERNLPLPTNLEPQRFRGLSIKEVMNEHYSAFSVDNSKLTGKKKRNIGRGLFTNDRLAAGEVTTLFAWGVVHSTEVTKENAHPSDIQFSAPSLSGLLLRCSANNPVLYINDCRGTGHKANVVLLECEIPGTRELHEYGLIRVQVLLDSRCALSFVLFVCVCVWFVYLLCLPIQATRDCPPGTELLLHYGRYYFAEGHPDDPLLPSPSDDVTTQKQKLKKQRARAKRLGRPVPALLASDGGGSGSESGSSEEEESEEERQEEPPKKKKSKSRSSKQTKRKREEEKSPARKETRGRKKDSKRPKKRKSKSKGEKVTEAGSSSEDAVAAAARHSSDKRMSGPVAKGECY